MHSSRLARFVCYEAGSLDSHLWRIFMQGPRYAKHITTPIPRLEEDLQACSKRKEESTTPGTNGHSRTHEFVFLSGALLIRACLP